MASDLSTDGYDVVTPVLTKVMPTSLTPDSELSHQADLLSHGKHSEDAVTQGSTEGNTEDESPKAKEGEATAGKKTDQSTIGEDAVAEATNGSLAADDAVEVDGKRYVKASGDHTWNTQSITINGIAYVPESAAANYKTAYSVLQQHTWAGEQDLSQGENNYTRSQFRGQPIMVYVGTQAYAVHPSVLIKSSIGSMALAEAEDGSFSIELLEDPIQFERLLTYLYQGTWDLNPGLDCAAWCGTGAGEVCGCWDNKRYMQLYAMACKYEVYGLAGIIAPRLNLGGDLLTFCEAFRFAYEMCPGNSSVRELFRQNLLTVFDNNLPGSPLGMAHCSFYTSDLDVTQLADLASCGGEFAVDLLKAFTMARATTVKEANRPLPQNAGVASGWDDDNEGATDEWHCRPAPATYNWDTKCRGDDAQDGADREQPPSCPAPAPNTAVTREDVTKIQDRLLDLEDMSVNAGSTSVIREEVKNIQGRLRDIENIVSNLQLNVARSAQSQRAAFPTTYPGIPQPHIPQGWGPSIPLHQPTCCQPGLGHHVMDENRKPRDQGWVGPQGGRNDPISEAFGEVVDCDDFDTHDNYENGGW